MNELLKVVLSLSLSGTLLILLLFLPRSLFKERLSKRWQYYIWLVVIARLLFPFAPETNLMARLFQGIDRPTEQMEIVSPYAQQSGIANTIQADETIHGQNNLHSEQMEPAKLVNSPNRNMVTMVWTNIWLGWLVMALILFIRKILICQSTGPLSLGNPVFSRALRFTRLPFSLDFSLARKFKGKPRQPLLTTLSRSLALERFASLVAWA